MGKNSESLFQKARNCIPGGVNSPVRAGKAVGIDPPFIAEANGCMLKDVDGNEYIDYVCSWGPMILGHTRPEIHRVLEEGLHRGTSYGAPTGLEVEMAEGRFREDLYYRLNVIPIYVPPLRQRREDIAPLLEHFLERASVQSSGLKKSLSPKALERLAAYPWPGNVRELQNIVERLVLMSPGPTIDVGDLPTQIAHPDREKLLRGLESEKLSDARAAFEREYLLEKLRANQWNISRTAEVVGLARESLSRKLRSLGITVEKQKDVE